MSEFDWNGVLQLPGAALAGERRIPKMVLVRQALLTKTEQKTLDKVAALAHFATVQKSTTRIPAHVDEGYDIQSVVFLRCEMTSQSQAVAEVAALVHKCFPNPTVLLMEAGGEVAVSAATTRRSLVEQGAVVIEGIEATGLFDPMDAAYAPFLEALAFERLPQDDLLAYLRALSQVAQLCRAVGSLGFYPQCTTQNRGRVLALVEEYNQQASVIRQLKERRRAKDVSLNESAKLRMQMRDEECKQTAMAAEIREMCDGQ